MPDVQWNQEAELTLRSDLPQAGNLWTVKTCAVVDKKTSSSEQSIKQALLLHTLWVALNCVFAPLIGNFVPPCTPRAFAFVPAVSADKHGGAVV